MPERRLRSKRVSANRSFPVVSLQNEEVGQFSLNSSNLYANRASCCSRCSSPSVQLLQFQAMEAIVIHRATIPGRLVAALIAATHIAFGPTAVPTGSTVTELVHTAPNAKDGAVVQTAKYI